MIVIAGKITIDPAHRDTAIAAAVELMQETRKETGCLSYTFSADLVDPGCFWIFEEWESPRGAHHALHVPPHGALPVRRPHPRRTRDDSPALRGRVGGTSALNHQHPHRIAGIVLRV